MLPCFTEWTRKENDETLANSINPKHPASGWERMNKERGPQVQVKRSKLKGSHKRAPQQIMFYSPHHHKKHIRKRKKWKRSKRRRRALTCNNIMPQNQDDLSSLQSYLSSLQSCWHPLLWKSTQNRWPQLSAKLSTPSTYKKHTKYLEHVHSSCLTLGPTVIELFVKSSRATNTLKGSPRKQS